jgi:UDP-N-acetylmuramoylalanine--D-glutamate ligase
MEDQDNVQTFGAIEIWDTRQLEAAEQELLEVYGAKLVDTNTIDLQTFMQQQDFIIVSPGVDVSAYPQQKHKILCELDFFATFFKKPVVAITGSVGKTTITRLLGLLIPALPTAQELPLLGSCGQYFRGKGINKIHAAVGGNVGIGMLDLVGLQEDLDVVVLELSSFQLDFNNIFSPSVAIWTNLYENHLDRHKTVENYFKAKSNIMKLQQQNDVGIVSYDSLVGPVKGLFAQFMPQFKGQLFVVATHRLSEQEVAMVPRNDFYILFYERGAVIVEMFKNKYSLQRVTLAEHVHFPDITFLINWLQVAAALYALGLDLAALPVTLSAISTEALLTNLAYRVRHFATINGVDFYDDSKSTIVQSTLAAVQRLAATNRPITLIIGGLGKGADRSWLMQALTSIPQVKRVLCFGPECNQFSGATVFDTLEKIVTEIGLTMQPDDIVLFSPSGASFDLFKNYEHRGQVFEQLIKKLA